MPICEKCGRRISAAEISKQGLCQACARAADHIYVGEEAVRVSRGESAGAYATQQFDFYRKEKEHDYTYSKHRIFLQQKTFVHVKRNDNH